MIEIEVTSIKGERISINLEYIQSIYESKKGTVIKLMLFKKWIVQEDFDEVLSRIEKEQGKEIFPDVLK